MYFCCTQRSLFLPDASRDCSCHALVCKPLVDFEVQDLDPDETTQASALKFLKEAVKGAFVQSVLTRPPIVAQSLASQRLE